MISQPVLLTLIILMGMVIQLSEAIGLQPTTTQPTATATGMTSENYYEAQLQQILANQAKQTQLLHSIQLKVSQGDGDEGTRVLAKLVALQQELRDLEWGGGAVGEAVDAMRQDLNTLRQDLDYSRGAETKQQERLLEMENKLNQINLMLRRVSNQIQELGRTISASAKAAAVNTSLLLSRLDAPPPQQCPPPPAAAPPLVASSAGLPHDCWDTLRHGHNRSGVYLVQPSPYHQPFLALCDMDTHGGGWTVFQMREDGSTDFMRPWREFETGFGNLATKEFWLGLDKLHLITNARVNDLLVTLQDHNGDSAWAYYQQFSVGNSNQDYTITSLGNYHGTAGDSLRGHVHKFSAPDRDNDINNGVSCGRSGGWWYTDCEDQDAAVSNLNGLYLNGSLPQVFPAQGMLWTTWRGLSYSIPHTAMMVRPSADVYTHSVKPTLTTPTIVKPTVTTPTIVKPTVTTTEVETPTVTTTEIETPTVTTTEVETPTDTSTEEDNFGWWN